MQRAPHFDPSALVSSSALLLSREFQLHLNSYTKTIPMKSLPKYISLLGLTLTFAPILHAEEKAAKPKQEIPMNQLNASFDVLADTINNARKQANEAMIQRDKVLAELAATRKAQEATNKELADLRKLQEKTSRELGNTKNQLAETKKSEAKLKKETEALSTQLKIGAEAREKIAALKTKMEKSLKDFSAIEKNLANVDKELQKPTAAGELKKELNALKSSDSASKKALTESKSKYEQQQSKAIASLKAVESKNKNLTKQLTEQEKTNQQTAKKLAELEKSNATATSELKKTQSELKTARENFAKIRQAHDRAKQKAGKVKQPKKRKAPEEAVKPKQTEASTRKAEEKSKEQPAPAEAKKEETKS